MRADLVVLTLFPTLHSAAIVSSCSTTDKDKTTSDLHCAQLHCIHHHCPSIYVTQEGALQCMHRLKLSKLEAWQA